MTVAQWNRIEIELTAVGEYRSPYTDVEVDVAFSDGSGTLVRPAFWAGGRRWLARFAPPRIGTWTYASASTAADDRGLHEVTGSFDCVPYEGGNPVYRHGFLTVSDSGRHLSHADGTPFFWLGDTHWQMPDTERIDACNHPEHRGGPCPFGGQFQHLVADRKQKGFTVYQTYPHAVNPAWWSSQFAALRPQRFDEAFDFEMDYLTEEGFVIALGFGHFNNATKIPPEDLLRWTRYLVARYGAHPVVWITCQEMNAPEDGDRNRIAVWESVAREIDRLDAYDHPHSAHQWVLDVDVRPLGGETWHDWFALQGGHAGSKLTPQSRYAGYWNHEPRKPMLETEAMYERIDCGGVADTDDARRSAWKAVLCGCAGYTYGAAGVWALKWDPEDPRWTNYNHPIEGWYAGMALPGSRQMSVLKGFFTAVDWPVLEPRFGDSRWSSFTDREESVLATVGSDLFVAYFHGPSREAGEVRGLDAAAAYRAWWFDPRTGGRTEIRGVTVGDGGVWKVPRKPTAEDWVLHVARE